MAEGQRPAARLRHVADIERREAGGLRLPAEPRDEGDQIGMAEIATPRETDDLVARPVIGQPHRAGAAAPRGAARRAPRPRAGRNDDAPLVAGLGQGSGGREQHSGGEQAGESGRRSEGDHGPARGTLPPLAPLLGAARAAAACASALRASEVRPAMPPKFMVSTALLGTMIVLPRSLTLS